MGWSSRIEQALAARRDADGWRLRRRVEHNSVREITLEGRPYRHFSSNDYLGLSQHPAVIAAWQQGAAEAGAGAGASGHVTGYSRHHAQLEEQLADWLGYKRALLFISGFAANQAVIHLLAEKQDRILADKLAHASLLDAPATARPHYAALRTTSRRVWQNCWLARRKAVRWW
jgi:8-amino-7-oxononanoate synthase (EC 2.3.1.47)